MRRNNLSFVLAALLLTFCLMAMTGGCSGSSSSRSSSNRNKFIDAVGDIADSLESIAQSALSNKKVVYAIEDIVGQYSVVDSSDERFHDTALYKSVWDGFVRSEDITTSDFKVGLFCEVISNKHIEVSHDIAEITANDTPDFQLTITSTDNHVTKLTVTPTSSTTYWLALAQTSAMFNSLNAGAAGQYDALFFAKLYESANIKVEYKGASETSYTTLLDGTINFSYPGKSDGGYVYENTPHTAKINAVLYPQDSKDYTIGIDLTRIVESNRINTLDVESELNMYRKSSSGSKSTLLNFNAATAAVMTPDKPTANARPTAMRIRKLDVNIADKIRLAESSAIDLIKLTRQYVTGTSASEADIASRVEKINELLADAGLSLYLNKSTAKAGDIRTLAGKISGYNHVRFGIRFNNSNEVELVRDIVNPEDLQKFRSLISSVSGQVRALGQLLENSGMFDNITDNPIIELIFNDLFGTK